MTGTLFLTGLSEKRLQLFKQAFPGAGRIAVLKIQRMRFGLRNAQGRDGGRADRHASSSVGGKHAPRLRALAPAALSGCDGLLVLPGGMFWNNRATILRLASVARVPAVYPEREYADDGGLIALWAQCACAFPSSCWLRRSYPSRSQPPPCSHQRHLAIRFRHQSPCCPAPLGLCFHSILSLPRTR